MSDHPPLKLTKVELESATTPLVVDDAPRPLLVQPPAFALGILRLSRKTFSGIRVIFLENSPAFSFFYRAQPPAFAFSQSGLRLSRFMSRALKMLLHAN